MWWKEAHIHGVLWGPAADAGGGAGYTLGWGLILQDGQQTSESWEMVTVWGSLPVIPRETWSAHSVLLIVPSGMGRGSHGSISALPHCDFQAKKLMLTIMIWSGSRRRLESWGFQRKILWITPRLVSGTILFFPLNLSPREYIHDQEKNQFACNLVSRK